ncbi:TPA: hypothetical protein PXJ37_002471 [Yersinia enterocolitica]|nr:hypothetical protein [Yersinia enterocolitica]HDM8324544.1 hypothetical protein [Yersinia enterocolitica]HEF7274261.1 hypothetical protein [Yersinia enterocolitica]HEK5866528.1 hypothetical protein [Yersinia enterocolitica]HEK6331047.1 hypothetical protein [Yersinia enterocolitica]
MIKVKIYKADKPLSLNEIIHKINDNLYSDDKGYGFHIINNGDVLEVRFTMRSISTQNIEYANGEHSEVEIASYLNVNFGIRYDKDFILYAINPPLSMKIPYTMVHKLFGEDSGLKPVELDLRKVINGLSSNFDLKIKSISLSNIPIDAFTLAKTKIVSSKSLSDIYRDSYMNSPALLDSAHFFVNGIETEISRTGRFRVRENQLPTLLSILESL